MYTQKLSQAPSRDRQGLISYILLEQGDVPATKLAITWVEVQPHAQQQPHSHAAEQAYVIVQGKGRMHVDNEQQLLSRGEVALVPPHATHYIENTDEETLIYVSAATPSFDLSDLYDKGALREEA